jgi:dihydrofolate synthase/folylpolyglutamate synthase
MRAQALGELAEDVFGADRVYVVPALDDAIERAVSLAEADDDVGYGGGGVVIGGSVITAGEARTLLRVDR